MAAASCPHSGGAPLGLVLCLLVLQVPLSKGSGMTPAIPESPWAPALPKSLRPPPPAGTLESPAPREGGAPPVPALASHTAAPGSVGRGGSQQADQLPTLLEGCGLQTELFGEEPSPTIKWPWQVSLQTRGEHVCGGTLISRQWVLTAARCISSFHEYMVLLGDTNRHGVNAVALYVPVQDIIIHKSFDNKTMNADIALMFLTFPVNYTLWVRPVCLPPYYYEVERNSKCWMTAWGILDKAEALPVELQETRQDTAQKWICIYIKEDSRIFTKGRILCSYQEDKNSACIGDYGGPLVCDIKGRMFQVGIMSWLIKCSPQEFSSVFTDVSFYKRWITDHMLLSSCNSVDFFLSLFLVLPLGILVTLDYCPECPNCYFL